MFRATSRRPGLLACRSTSTSAGACPPHPRPPGQEGRGPPAVMLDQCVQRLAASSHSRAPARQCRRSAEPRSPGTIPTPDASSCVRRTGDQPGAHSATAHPSKYTYPAAGRNPARGFRLKTRRAGGHPHTCQKTTAPASSAPSYISAEDKVTGHGAQHGVVCPVTIALVSRVWSSSRARCRSRWIFSVPRRPSRS